MIRFFPSDRQISIAFVGISDALLKRYGGSTDSSRQQIEKTIADLRFPRRVLPYMLAGLLSEENFQSLKAEMPKVKWDEVKMRVRRIIAALPSRPAFGDHFHESNIGYPTE